MKPTPKTKTKGGKRPGAGRPASEPTLPTRMPIRIIKAAREKKAAGGPAGDTVTAILSEWTERGMKLDPECYLKFQP